MRVSRPYSSLFLLLLTILSVSVTVRAEDDEPEEYDLKTRVVRISLINGDVTLKRRSSNDWEKARLNYPLVEGDTIATDRDSKVEIQIDGKNFIRLSSNSMLRLSTLRDEGVALTIFEGAAVLRLAKFDKNKEYFEIDAPKSTLAAEKKGLYRVDVSTEGRVRLTVKDGGSARIYSETSGFALRDARAAELITEGDNAGDWEFVSVFSDATDKWVNDRERYLAQHLRYDTQYYDEYLWGAEDLASYGDWEYGSDYGWTWRPRGLSVYADWAPYRYGHWTWLDPYGWTWVGYEPWGWAPYHYGRWVYYNGGWVWSPRSYYYRHRSWWRPALVAFYYGNYNNYNSYCWYPLRYRQRDPGSSYYSNNPARLTALRVDELATLRRINPVELRAVTSAAARQIGSDDLRPRRADDELAQRAVGAAPIRGLPARAPERNSSTPGTERGDGIVGRPARATPPVNIAERSTGAATRTAGVPLDDELRRNRVLNGREARPGGPFDTSNGNSNESRPTGAVSRPARSRDSSGGDSSNGSNGETRPRETTGAPARSDDGAPARPSVDTTNQPQRDTIDRPVRDRTRSEPARPSREESPRYEAPPQRSEPIRVETPRSEPPRSSPAPRNDPPPQRSEPRSEPARPSRPDNDRPARSEPRSESPRSEPRNEAPRSEPPRSEPSRSEPQRSEPPRSESPRSEPPRSAPDRPESDRPARPRDPRR